MNLAMALRRGGICLALSAALAGCASLSPPGASPAAGESGPGVACPDISGTYRASTGGKLLPFFLFGVTDTTSSEWAALVAFALQLQTQADDAVVSIGAPNPDRLEVVVAVRGRPSAQQVLTRARSPLDQSERSFRCERDGVAIAGTQIVDWDEYLLPDSEKKRRYRRPGTNDVGTARGVYHFSRAADGGLVMRQQVYFCLGDCELPAGARWEPARPAASRTDTGAATAR